MSKKHRRQSDPTPPEGAPAEPPAEDVRQDDQAPPAEDMQKLQQERDDLLARLQRLGADYQNYQKRVRRDIEQARQFANEELIKSLLSILDDMERALQAARENHEEDDPLLKGMEMVHDKAVTTLAGFGLETIEPEGQPFDPERHSAMMQQPSAEHPPHTVLQVLQKGYALKGRTLRPAAVVVSTEPGEAGPVDAPE